MDEYTNLPRIDPSRTNSAREAAWLCGHSNPHCDQDVNLKIHSAFAATKSFPFKMIIFQFWQPRVVDERHVLECCGSPYAVAPYNRHLRDKYRSLCMKYQFCIDKQDNPNSNPPWILSGGPVATAFRNHFPEVVVDLRVHQGSSPLVDCGLECDLTCCVMLPIFFYGSSRCIGVVECSMRHPGLLLPMLNELKRELEKEGLSIYHVQGSLPYKTITRGNLEAAKIEIEKGLKIACESHDLTLAQVWISSTQTERTVLVNLSGYSVDPDDNSIKDVYDTFDVILGEGLLLKTLETHKPYLCKNMDKMSENNGVLALLSANTKSTTCLVIFLRSTHTGELDYAFAFLWPCNRNHLILLETLLLILRKYLPSFKFASGEQLGDDLISIVDVENETKTSVSVKRDDDNDDDDVAILAAYRREGCLFYLPSSSPYEIVMNKLNKEFELDPGRTYEVDYEVYPGRWCGLVCLESCRRREDMGVIKLRVRPQGREVSWRWRTKGDFHWTPEY